MAAGVAYGEEGGAARGAMGVDSADYDHSPLPPWDDPACRP
jgi:hypothetical protein